MVIEMGHGKGQAFCPFGTLFSFDEAHNMGVRPWYYMRCECIPVRHGCRDKRN